MTKPESGVIRTLQIITMALLMGAGTFLVIVSYLVTTGDPRGDSGPLVPILFVAWVAVGAGGLVAWPLIRRKQARLAAAAVAENGEGGRVLAAQRYASATIVGAAIAEGSTLLVAAGGFATGHPGLLAAGLVGLVVIVLLFPTQQKFEHFLERGRGSRPS